MGNHSVSDFKRALKTQGTCVVVGFTTMSRLLGIVIMGKLATRAGAKTFRLKTGAISKEGLVAMGDLMAVREGEARDRTPLSAGQFFRSPLLSRNRTRQGEAGHRGQLNRQASAAHRGQYSQFYRQGRVGTGRNQRERTEAKRCQSGGLPGRIGSYPVRPKELTS